MDDTISIEQPIVSTIQEDLEKKITVESQEHDYMIFIVIILSLTTMLSISISFYLYKWRKILLSNPNMVVPEEWAKHLMAMGNNINNINATVTKTLGSVKNETSNNTVKISQMTDTYMELQLALDEKDNEIKRLKKGYDAEIFKRFISRFVRIEQSLDDFISEEGEMESYTFLKRLFEDAFEECGVYKFKPDIGEDYRKAIGVADNPKKEKTTEPTQDFKIFEVIEEGYQVVNGDVTDVIIPAKVKIYRLG
mgnify:FL=1|tara:strand:- start:8496 stop:9248 length:753 start_codon:yes stop_codon:yes gene_type:complete